MKKGSLMGKKYSAEELREARDESRQMGMVLTKLEIMHTDIKEIKSGHSVLEERVSKIENRCSAEHVVIDGLREDLRKDATGTAGFISGAGLLIGGILIALGKFFGLI